MAIYHFSAKAVTRASGRSAIAAAAYRAGERLFDARTGTLHDYTRKSGVMHCAIFTPYQELALSREALWNAAESAEKRKDSCVAREYIAALPAELNDHQRKILVEGFSKYLAKYRGCAVDVAIHAPSRSGDQRNHHAHLLCTTREYLPDGTLSAKVMMERAGQNRKADLKHLRKAWERAVNLVLEHAQITSRVDSRSYVAQGIKTPPTAHLGASATQVERKQGVPSDNRTRWMVIAAQQLQSLVSQTIKSHQKQSMAHQESRFQKKERTHER